MITNIIVINYVELNALLIDLHHEDFVYVCVRV